MIAFIDHLQLLPVPFRNGRRQPDGKHRPGGLGMATLGEILGRRGWTARVEDLGFDKPMPERRLAESFARTIADAVLSAWDRTRFPVVLTRTAYGTMGVIDAMGPSAGVVWVDAAAGYRVPGLVRRPALEASALALLTGRAPRDRLAVRPQQVPGRQVILIGGEDGGRTERRMLDEDGVHRLSPASLERLPGIMDAVPASRWYLHVDLSAFENLDREAFGATVRSIFGSDRPLGAASFGGYDLNDDPDGRVAVALSDLIEAAALAAGGTPRPVVAAH